MTPDTPTQITKSLLGIDTKILTLVYDDLAKPGVQQVGKALSTVLGLGNTALLPLKLANEKAQLWYTKHMEEYRQRLENVPEEKIVEVAPEIGVPVMENLEKTTSERVSELYLNLLANASTIDFVANTHPRFVSVIESITSDEITLLKILEEFHTIPFINIMATAGVHNITIPENLSYSLPNNTVTKIINNQATMLEKTSFLSLPDKSKFYFQNLQGLSLVRADTENFMATSDYSNLLQTFMDETKSDDPAITHNTSMGYYELTEFGKLFLKACHAQPKE